jgi:hypothetical protein
MLQPETTVATGRSCAEHGHAHRPILATDGHSILYYSCEHCGEYAPSIVACACGVTADAEALQSTNDILRLPHAPGCTHAGAPSGVTVPRRCDVPEYAVVGGHHRRYARIGDVVIPSFAHARVGDVVIPSFAPGNPGAFYVTAVGPGTHVELLGCADRRPSSGGVDCLALLVPVEHRAPHAAHGHGPGGRSFRSIAAHRA